MSKANTVGEIQSSSVHSVSIQGGVETFAIDHHENVCHWDYTKGEWQLYKRQKDTL